MNRSFQRENHYYTSLSMKLKMLDFCGRRCLKCGYDKCRKALEFHHINPEEKDRDISALKERSWSFVKIELEKTILLCANCHREIHEDLSLLTIELIEKQKRLQKSYVDLPLNHYLEWYLIQSKRGLRVHTHQ